MSLEKIKPILNQFIGDDGSGLIVLKGRWGVGKTYFWHSLMREACEENRILNSHYAYVSLFGINSPEELRNRIFASRIKKEAVKSIDNNHGELSGFDQIASQAEEMPWLRRLTGGLLSTAAFLSIRDTLICFDDIERKGNGLSAKDFLGLISLLKEQRNCKVAIILNEDSLEALEKELFKRHGEKLIDLELNFITTPDYAIACIFSEDDEYYPLISDYCGRLHITNIRILQRIKRYIAGIAQFVEKSEEQVMHAVIHSIILFVWAYYDKDSNAPTFGYIKRYGYKFFQAKEEDMNEDERTWRRILQEYDYRYTDEVDLEIADYVEKGYVDTDSFSVKLEAKNRQIHSQQGQDHYRQAWGLYYNSFENNEEKFVEEIVSSFKKNMAYLSPMNLNSTVDILRELDRTKIADLLIDEYAAFYSSQIEVLDITGSQFRYDKFDAYILRKFSELVSKVAVDKNLGEVLKKIASQNGWGGDEEDFLASRSVDDYYTFFKREKSDKLQACIQTSLAFGKPSNATDRQKTIAGKATEALMKIARESRLNRIRVAAMYGIEINDNDSTS